MHASSPTSERWSWPAGCAIVLYQWRWYDPDQGEVVSGWSQQHEPDDAGYVDLEADALHDARTRRIPTQRRRFVVVEPYTFTSEESLPPLLTHDSGPQTWICALLGLTPETRACHGIAHACP